MYVKKIVDERDGTYYRITLGNYQNCKFILTYDINLIIFVLNNSILMYYYYNVCRGAKHPPIENRKFIC